MDDYQFMMTIAVAVIAVFYFIRKAEKKAEEDDEEELQSSSTSSASTDIQTAQVSNRENEKPKAAMDNQDLLKTILTQLNCQYQAGEDDDYWFTYQGEHFNVSYDKDSFWVRIYDMQWFACSLDELENISYMQKAINLCNSRFCCTAYYYVDTDKKTFRVYSKCDFLLNEVFPAPEQYFQAWLTQFFRLKHEIVLQYDKERTQETINKESTKI